MPKNAGGLGMVRVGGVRGNGEVTGMTHKLEGARVPAKSGVGLSGAVM